MAGVARENISRTMSEWRKRNIVTRSSDYYCINDPTALAQETRRRQLTHAALPSPPTNQLAEFEGRRANLTNELPT